jgi:uncharacterized protein
MKAAAGNIRLSASDLSNHLACNHLTTLDLAVATGSLSLPKWNSPDAWVLQPRGIAHEAAYIQHLRSQGHSVVNLQDTGGEETAFEKTCAAMQTGADVIVQAVLAQGGNWFGRADVLRKVALPSKLGDWSYEVYDCKLALETKAGTILQLSLYSDLLAGIQRRLAGVHVRCAAKRSIRRRVLPHSGLRRLLPLRKAPLAERG